MFDWSVEAGWDEFQGPGVKHHTEEMVFYDLLTWASLEEGKNMSSGGVWKARNPFCCSSDVEYKTCDWPVWPRSEPGHLARSNDHIDHNGNKPGQLQHWPHLKFPPIVLVHQTLFPCYLTSHIQAVTISFNVKPLVVPFMTLPFFATIVEKLSVLHARKDVQSDLWTIILDAVHHPMPLT